MTRTSWKTTEPPFDPTATLTLDREDIERVNQFVYLGHQISFPRDHNREIGRRIASAWATFNRAQQLLTNKRTPMFIKGRFYQQCIAPSLLYACETWALTNTTETRIARCQRAMERRLLNIRLRDKKSAAFLRKRTNLKDTVVAARTRKWKHAQKMMRREDEQRWDTRLLRWTPLASAHADDRALATPTTSGSCSALDATGWTS
jgi:hypothetical protein